MLNPSDMAERHARILAELSELGLGLARQAAGDAAAAETPEERGRAAMVFQRVSRSVRQSLALEAKLARDARRDAAAEANEQAERRREKVAHRRVKLREAVDRLVWNETEAMDFAEEEAFDGEIEAAVEAERDTGSFLTDPLSDQVARVIARLSYEIAADGRARRIPEPAPEPGPAPQLVGESGWQGSG